MAKTDQNIFIDMKMKHLEFIQNVISRMANNSLLIKNYTIVLSAAMMGLATAVNESNIILYSIPLILIFSLLDANYLRLERSFVSQYEAVRRQKENEEIDFKIRVWTQLNQVLIPNR